MAELTVRIACPACDATSSAMMPGDRCVYFYECPQCKSVLKPKRGDCCVFCSYGDKRCPFAQDNVPCPDSEQASKSRSGTS